MTSSLGAEHANASYSCSHSPPTPETITIGSKFFDAVGSSATTVLSVEVVVVVLAAVVMAAVALAAVLVVIVVAMVAVMVVALPRIVDSDGAVGVEIRVTLQSGVAICALQDAKIVSAFRLWKTGKLVVCECTLQLI